MSKFSSFCFTFSNINHKINPCESREQGKRYVHRESSTNWKWPDSLRVDEKSEGKKDEEFIRNENINEE